MRFRPIHGCPKSRYTRGQPHHPWTWTDLAEHQLPFQPHQMLSEIPRSVGDNLGMCGVLLSLLSDKPFAKIEGPHIILRSMVRGGYSLVSARSLGFNLEDPVPRIFVYLCIPYVLRTEIVLQLISILELMVDLKVRLARETHIRWSN